MSITALKEEVEKEKRTAKHNINLAYITSRERWYFTSWKGNINESGGVATNIGIHFFDMLLWIFGSVDYQELHHSDEKKMAGFMSLEKANVRWFLSVDRNDLPAAAKKKKLTTYRSITVDNKEIEFSGGFEDLHTLVYRDILSGKGYGVEDARASIKLISELRNTKCRAMAPERANPLLLQSK